MAVDGSGQTYECVLESVDRGVATGRVIRRTVGRGELKTPIALLVGLPDPGPTETVVVHAVPLGVSSIDFVACARSGRPALGAARLERLSRIAVSALKQSRRSRLPSIRSSASLEAGLALLDEGSRIVADPLGSPHPSNLDRSPQANISLAVGPPGGFTEQESQALRSCYFDAMSLGDSRLSTETAAIAIVAVVSNRMK